MESFLHFYDQYIKSFPREFFLNENEEMIDLRHKAEILWLKKQQFMQREEQIQ